MINQFEPLEHPYKWVTLHENESNRAQFFIETEYGKTWNYIHFTELFDYVKVRIEEGTVVTIKPLPVKK